MGELSEDTQCFIEKTEDAFRALFDAARSKNELHFAFSLAPEFRGEQGPGWCTWEETNRAFDEYLEFINQKPTTSFRVRVALGFYCHLAEASGFYEAPKNLLRVAGGEEHRLWPFLELNRKHAETGKVIAPNTNRIFRDLIGYSKSLGFEKLSEVFRDAFDSDIRNAYSHADYVIWTDGLRIRNQAGGFPKIIKWDDFDQKLLRAINFYHVLRELIKESIASFDPPKEVVASVGNQPSFRWTLKFDSESGAFSISTSGF